MHRIDDPAPIRIVREVPLWGIVIMLFSIVAQAVSLFYAQQSQGESIQRMTVRIVELTSEIRQLSVSANVKDIKDAEHDFKLQDHERRLANVERTNR